MHVQTLHHFVLATPFRFVKQGIDSSGAITYTYIHLLQFNIPYGMFLLELLKLLQRNNIHIYVSC